MSRTNNISRLNSFETHSMFQLKSSKKRSLSLARVWTFTKAVGGETLSITHFFFIGVSTIIEEAFATIHLVISPLLSQARPKSRPTVKLREFSSTLDLCPFQPTTFNHKDPLNSITSNPDTPDTMPASVHSQDSEEHDQSMMDVEAEQPVNPILLDEKRIIVVSHAPWKAHAAT